MDVREVLPRDAIRSIDEPRFGQSYFGESDDEVVVVDGEPPRAYPVRILSHHEIVNDDAARPIAVTWCPICGSGVVYDRSVAGRVLTFGVSGKLADDALVMYDRETATEWKQPTGQAIAGDLVGTSLDALPATMTTWARFAAEYPDGVVLQPAIGGSDAPSPREAYDVTHYEQYAADDAFGLYGMRGEGQPRSWERSDIDAKTVVLGVAYGGEAVGYPEPVVEAAGGVVTDAVGGRAVVVVAREGIHAFENPGFDFDLRDGLRADGAVWDPVTGESDDDRRLDRIPARRLFAFAWQDAHGPDSFFGL